mmetsp:Transcript_32714/g.75285  ORF Transcript_32714/g.75285 Transcript_32714/m.75285 type:complete len:130 (-) Transcript_32714:746-1135(-)|eukprot:CAMPEP_0113297140 /NCGR_PEP_ID=MMETSP0010_2-20120614/125_1 /TAXON_ID=216773 ORGANISM="Corethron hystrix, Strain 308" /NCGR_SAMPLE_ID=MMETSP0010_2 /ASSEMBLY_ACC=CAM_ASM_000155 /LENGTH=129 /DNA_ID=CAMNT_0000149977 /DNA_START=167 /DNA_END=556 /DNA_ORIENTATION=- /assembly_acc=CAM_ASM_000155
MSKKKTIATPINSREELASWLECDDTLLIIDLHLKWCGNCECVEPWLQKLKMEYDSIGENIKLASLEIPKFADDVKELVTFPEDLEMEFDPMKHCPKPVFIAVRSKRAVATVVGPDVPAIHDVIKEAIR